MIVARLVGYVTIAVVVVPLAAILLLLWCAETLIWCADVAVKGPALAGAHKWRHPWVGFQSLWIPAVPADDMPEWAKTWLTDVLRLPEKEA